MYFSLILCTKFFMLDLPHIWLSLYIPTALIFLMYTGTDRYWQVLSPRVHFHNSNIPVVYRSRLHVYISTTLIFLMYTGTDSTHQPIRLGFLFPELGGRLWLPASVAFHITACLREAISMPVFTRLLETFLFQDHS